MIQNIELFIIPYYITLGRYGDGSKFLPTTKSKDISVGFHTTTQEKLSPAAFELDKLPLQAIIEKTP